MSCSLGSEAAAEAPACWKALMALAAATPRALCQCCGLAPGSLLCDEAEAQSFPGDASCEWQSVPSGAVVAEIAG